MPSNAAQWALTQRHPGFYTYAVAATADGGEGRSATVSAVVPPQGSGGLSVETLRMPQWTRVARDGAGRWFTAFDSNLLPISAGLTLCTRDAVSGWQSTVLRQNNQFERNWVAFDASKRLLILTPIGPASDGFRDYAFFDETP